MKPDQLGKGLALHHLLPLPRDVLVARTVWLLISTETTPTRLTAAGPGQDLRLNYAESKMTGAPGAGLVQAWIWGMKGALLRQSACGSLYLLP